MNANPAPCLEPPHPRSAGHVANAAVSGQTPNPPERNAGTAVQLIAIVGGSGAGKGWFVNQLCRVLGDVACHLQLDDFYRDLAHLPLARRAEQNFDVPDAIDWDWAGRTLRACRAGQPTTIPGYDFATHCRTTGRSDWTPRPLVLVDGLWLLHRPQIRELFALSVFLDAPSELRHARRLSRDVVERGYTREAIERQLRSAVAPMHERYVEPQKEWADLILAQPFQEAELLTFADRLWPLLPGAKTDPAAERETFRASLLSLLPNHEYCN